MTSELPLGWKQVPVIDLLESMTGGVWGNQPGMGEVDVTVARVTEFHKSGTLNLATAATRSVTQRQAASRELQDTDLLLEKSGGGPNTPVGRVVRVPPHKGTLIPTNFVQLLRPSLDVVDDRYLFWLLWSWHDNGRSIPFQTATTNIRNLKTRDYLSQLAPVPQLPEQKRIVAAIEEQFSRLDAAEVALWSAERRIRALEKSVITEASSTLTPPPHWKIAFVADAGTVGLGLQRSPKRHNGPNMRPYLRVANVFEDRIDDSDVMSMDMTEAEWERYRLRDGDVLLNEGQSPELLGRPAIYRGKPPNIAFTNSLIRFRAKKDIDPEWALLVFRSHMHNRRFMRESQITTNIAHLSAGRFKTVEFPVPPLDEQQARVADARVGLVGCARLRAEVAAARRRSTNLRRSLLAAAFSGRLVPQDRDQEQAEGLLERTQRERAAGPMVKEGTVKAS
jgi:type I restriction enzyme S subunit